MGSIPNQGTRIPHATQHGEKKKKNQICERKGERERGKKGGREEGWTLSPEGWQELQVMSSAASAKWSLVSDPGEQGSGIWFLSEPGLTTACLGSLPSPIWNLLLLSVIPPISGSEVAISPRSGPKKGRLCFLPDPHFFPRREDRHVPGLFPIAREHHTCLPRLPGTGQCDRGDVLRILLPESKRNYDFTALSFNHLARVVVSGRGRCPWGTAALCPPWSQGGS